MKQKFIEWFTKNNNGCSPAMEDDRSFVYEMTQHMFEAYQAGVAEGEARCAALAAENAGLKSFISQSCYSYDGDGSDVCDSYVNAEESQMFPKTPATEAFLAGVQSKAREEGAYFVANRMLAAWDAGFIDDTARNAADIARMILTSTEFMADAPEGDFDRSFADGVLEDIAAQLRQEAAQ